MTQTANFNLYQSRSDQSLWLIRLRKLGSYVERRFRADTLREALDRAPHAVGLGKPGESKVDRVSILDAMTGALAGSERREGTTCWDQWWDDCHRFLSWLQKKHPLTTSWKQLDRAIILEYKTSVKSYSDSTKKKRLGVLRQTDIYMADAFGLPEITRNLKIGNKLKNGVATVYIADVLDFLEFLRNKRPHVEAPVALTGLAGLSVQEALRLSWQNVDLEHGRIAITGKIRVDVKNEYRVRTIPVCSIVLDVLRRANEQRQARPSRKVIDLNEKVVVGENGEAYVRHDSYRPIFNRAIKAWNSEIKWAPKDLRNCILTFADDDGIRSANWEEYTGHSVGGVTKKHYVPSLHARTRGQKEALEKKMQSFVKHIIAPLEEGILQARQESETDETWKILGIENENAAE